MSNIFLMPPRLFCAVLSNHRAQQNRVLGAHVPASCGTSVKSSNIAQNLIYVAGIKKSKTNKQTK